MVARRHHRDLWGLVRPMLRGSLTCFVPESFARFEERFRLDLTENEAREYMKALLEDSLDKWTTNWYDRIQWMQNKIHH